MPIIHTQNEEKSNVACISKVNLNSQSLRVSERERAKKGRKRDSKCVFDHVIILLWWRWSESKQAREDLQHKFDIRFLLHVTGGANMKMVAAFRIAICVNLFLCSL